MMRLVRVNLTTFAPPPVFPFTYICNIFTCAGVYTDLLVDSGGQDGIHAFTRFVPSTMAKSGDALFHPLGGAPPHGRPEVR